MSELIRQHAELERAARALASSKTLFIDTEFESTRAGSELCLLQVSDGTQVWLIDPLALRDLSPLAPVFGAEDVEWVLHAGLQDVALLTRALGIEAPKRLFDTQIAWSLTSIEHAVSLSYVVYRVLGKRTSKPHQADDWKRRPLPRPQLRYAASDVEHLPAIRADLGARLERLSRADVVYQASHEVLNAEPPPPSTLDVSSFRNAWQLGAKSQAVLQELIGWYNALGEAERAAAPGAKVLLSIAMRLPSSVDDLVRVKGVPARWASDYGRALVNRIVRAAGDADEAAHSILEPPPYATADEIRVEGWLDFARAELAVRTTVAPELLLPHRWMRTLVDAVQSSRLASAAPNALTGWRRMILADAFERFCEEHPLVL